MSLRKEFLPYSLPMLGEDEINEVIDTLKSNWITRGPKTAEFEKMFAEYVGTKHAVAMNSCTAALHVGLICAGIGPGDEVITTPFTFCATANAIIHTGARPVLVDIDPATYCIDVNKIESAITPKTRAIIPVHYAGQACDMDAIMDIAEKYDLFVLEDAAHAVYTQYNGKMIGSIGHATAFSFYATKNLTTAEGGMLTTDDDVLADKARVISLHGMSRNAWNRYSATGSWYYEVEYAGFKYNMTDIQASLGIHQLKRLEEMQRLRAQWADMYNQAFAEIPEIITPYIAPWTRPSWHIYAIQIDDDKLSINRDQFIEELKKENIGTSVHFIPLYMHPYYRERFDYKASDFPVTDKVYSRILSLPLYPSMSRQDVEDVIEAVKRIVEKYRVVKGLKTNGCC